MTLLSRNGAIAGQETDNGEYLFSEINTHATECADLAIYAEDRHFRQRRSKLHP